MPGDLIKVPHVVRVMGIDPSTTNMGVTVIDVDISKRTPFKLIYSNTIYGDKVIYDVPDQYDDTAGTSVAARSYCLARALGYLIDIYMVAWSKEEEEENGLKIVKSLTGITEDNFLGMSALTFKQLIQFVSLSHEEFIDRGIHVSNVLPNQAKDIVGANFRGTQKEDVREGLLAYDWLDHGDVDLDVIDEHAVDSGAITLYRCEHLAKQWGVFRDQFI